MAPKRAVGFQRWNHLLFVHWKVPASEVQATLPAGLTVDTFRGDAYVGIVPFFMQRVRPAWLPAVPWVSWFLELNVRTYVRDSSGRPGVWFYSLDCNQPIAVAIARRFYHLPYFSARMSARSAPSGAIDYRCQRRGPAAAASRFVWTPGAASALAQPGTLEFFLVERYLLFSANRAGRLFEGQVRHHPYRITAAAVQDYSTVPAEQAGFQLSGPPDSLLCALPVDVSVFSLAPVSA